MSKRKNDRVVKGIVIIDLRKFSVDEHEEESLIIVGFIILFNFDIQFYI